MAIVGARRWDDSNAYYSQENNPTESYNKAVLDSRGSWLESCGPTAAVNCMAAMGRDLTVTCPGQYKPQPEEVLMDFFNDPRNRVKLREIRDLKDPDIPGNRVPQYYPFGVKAVFGVEAHFSWGADWDTIVSQVKLGRAVQLTLKSPGHYIAVIAYDIDAQRLIYNDSWGSRFGASGGFHRLLEKEEVESNVQPYRIVYL